jgi:Tfp pilus assembly protein PilX
MPSIFYSKAFILITVLIFIFISSLLVLASLSDALLANKLSHNLHRQHLSMVAAEAGLRQAEQALANKTHLSCLYDAPLNIDLGIQNINWWQHQCQGHFPNSHVYYVLETLPVSSCVAMPQAANHLIKLYRVTSFAKTAGALTLLQSVYALQTHSNCLLMTHQPHQSLGRLSWRQIN